VLLSKSRKILGKQSIIASEGTRKQKQSKLKFSKKKERKDQNKNKENEY
jgi:hypothetical protein